MSTTVSSEAAPDSGHGHRHLGAALLLICLAQLMVVLDSTIANIALPYIGRDLHIDQANLSWIVTGYALAFGGLLLLGGRLGDLYGRRRVFMIGVTVFALASALGGLAQNEAMLLASRGLQGLGAAIASPTALALITTTFPAGPQRNRAFSVYAAMSGVGAAVGLLLGGWLTGVHSIGGLDVQGWRLTFLINVPIGLAAAFFAPRVLGESESSRGRLDVPGALTGTLGLVSIVYGLTRASQTDATGSIKYGWTDPGTIGALVLGVVLLASFVIIERRVKHPLMPFRILANRNRAVAFAVMFVVPAAMFAMFFFLSLYVQNVMGYSPLQTGVAFLPFAPALVISATVASKLIARMDPRLLTGIGTIMAGVALFGFSRIPTVDGPSQLLHMAGHGGYTPGTGYWTDIFPFIVLMALGMGLNFVPMTLTAVHGVGKQDSGIGSGVLNTMQQVGGALGLATLSTVAVHYTESHAKSLAAGIRPVMNAVAGGPASGHQAMQQLSGVIGKAAFSHGATEAFFAGGFMMLGASVLVWLFLNVKHEELATDDHPEVVAA